MSDQFDGKVKITSLVKYALNCSMADKTATTQFSGGVFNFLNSMCRFGDLHLAASKDGIYDLSGDDDDGAYIEAYLEPVATDFGVSNPKKTRFVDVGYESDGNLNLTVIGEDSERTFSIESLKEGQQGRRVKCSRDVKGRHLTYRISNINGCDFGLDEIAVTFVVVPHNL